MTPNHQHLICHKTASMSRQIHLSIRAQLSLVVCLVVVVSLGVLSGATYATNKNVVINLRRGSLTNIAQLKSSQVTQAIDTLAEQLLIVTSRSYTESVLSYYFSAGPLPSNNLSAQQLQNAIMSVDDSVQGTLYAAKSATEFVPVLSVTNRAGWENVTVPSSLYPSTFLSGTELDNALNTYGTYLVGPMLANDTFLISLTHKVSFGLTSFDADGILTVVVTAKPILEVIYDPSALGPQGQMAIIELTANLTTTTAETLPSSDVTNVFVFPTTLCPGCFNITFTATSFSNQVLLNHTSGSMIDIDYLELGSGTASVGFSPINALNRNWGVLIYQSDQTVFVPLYKLRNMLLISMFSIGAGMCIGTLLLTRWAVKPITVLQQATEQSTGNARPKKRGWRAIPYWLGLPSGASRVKNYDDDDSLRPVDTTGFRIPGHIEQKRFIKDELTELTDKFNEMTTELRKQYAVLEDRVLTRTKEIESARLIAENANKAKSLFIANITHELRTPLNGILGMTAVSMDETDSKKIKDSLKIIFKSGELLLHLLTDLLTFSKNQDVESVDLEEREFIVGEILSQLTAIFGEQSKAAKINLTIDTKTDDMKAMIVYGDINRILQIIINLVSNGLKFTPAGGSVEVLVDLSWFTCSDTVKGPINKPPLGSSTLAVRKNKIPSNFRKSSDEGNSSENDNSQGGSKNDICLSSSPKTDGNASAGSPEHSIDDRHDDIIFEDQCVHLKVSVKDTGPGIADHLQDKIFEAFVQGDLQLSERRGGAGLGLSICRQLAKLMNGSVEVQSKLGEGSTFTFTVPLRAVKESSKYVYSDLNAITDWPEYELYNKQEQRFMPDSIDSSISQETADKVCNIGIMPLSREDASVHNYSSPTTPGSVTTTASSVNTKRPSIMRNPSNRSKEDDRKVPSHVQILIAEDNKVNQEVMVRMLRLEGIENAVIANDGLEAVSLVRESNAIETVKYDLVFMDVQMPNLDGLQATSILRNELGYSGPIVGVSAFADTSNIKDCLNVGMNHFLAKPLRRPQLHHLLLEIFYGENHLREAIK